MYESASGERFTIYAAQAATEATQMRYAAQDKDGALFWADRGVGYVVSGRATGTACSRSHGWSTTRPRNSGEATARWIPR